MADYALAPVDYDPFAGDYGQGMSPDAFAQAGNFLRWSARISQYEWSLCRPHTDRNPRQDEVRPRLLRN